MKILCLKFSGLIPSLPPSMMPPLPPQSAPKTQQSRPSSSTTPTSSRNGKENSSNRSTTPSHHPTASSPFFHPSSASSSNFHSLKLGPNGPPTSFQLFATGNPHHLPPHLMPSFSPFAANTNTVGSGPANSFQHSQPTKNKEKAVVSRGGGKWCAAHVRIANFIVSHQQQQKLLQHQRSSRSITPTNSFHHQASFSSKATNSKATNFEPGPVQPSFHLQNKSAPTTASASTFFPPVQTSLAPPNPSNVPFGGLGSLPVEKTKNSNASGQKASMSSSKKSSHHHSSERSHSKSKPRSRSRSRSPLGQRVSQKEPPKEMPPSHLATEAMITAYAQQHVFLQKYLIPGMGIPPLPGMPGLPSMPPIPGMPHLANFMSGIPPLSSSSPIPQNSHYPLNLPPLSSPAPNNSPFVLPPNNVSPKSKSKQPLVGNGEPDFMRMMANCPPPNKASPNNFSFNQFFDNKNQMKKEIEETKPKQLEKETRENRNASIMNNDDELACPKKLKKYKFSYSTENLIGDGGTCETTEAKPEWIETVKKEESTETKSIAIEPTSDVKDETLNYSTDADESMQKTSEIEPNNLVCEKNETEPRETRTNVAELTEQLLTESS